MFNIWPFLVSLLLILLLGVGAFCFVWFTTKPVNKKGDVIAQIADDVARTGKATWLLTVTLDERGEPRAEIKRWEG